MFALEATKKKCLAVGKFKASWKLPDGIITSSKCDQYAHCKLCKSDFSVAHGGFNDITRHSKGPTHQQRFKYSNSTKGIAGMLGQPSEQLSHIRKVTTAEVIMSNFIAMHNISFLTANHLSSLFAAMFPDSKIASDFSCKCTKARAIVCEALDPYHKNPIVENIRNVPYSRASNHTDLSVFLRIYTYKYGLRKLIQFIRKYS